MVFSACMGNGVVLPLGDKFLSEICVTSHKHVCVCTEAEGYDTLKACTHCIVAG